VGQFMMFYLVLSDGEDDVSTLGLGDSTGTWSVG
jgi:hypothetical protein